MTTPTQVPDALTVFAAGSGYPSVRIPSIAVTNTGTVLAFAEGRQRQHDHAQNDIILRRSDDGGTTWGPLQVVADEGGDSLNDPSVSVDRRSGRVVLHYTRFAEGYHTDRAPVGYDAPHASRNYVIHSADDGRSWSAPLEVTRQVRRAEVGAGIVTCGVGIQLRHGTHAGRLVHAVYQSREQRGRESYVCFSDDGGTTWAMGELAPFTGEDRTAEPQVVELADGAVMLNARTITGRRRVALSNDGGATFGPLEHDETLIDPGCQASILRYSDPLDGERSRILFANAASATDRVNGSVRLSYDEGRTWPVAQTIYAGSFAYSCLTVLKDGTIGCLFERDNYGEIVLARFSLAWLTDGRDPGPQGNSPQ